MFGGQSGDATSYTVYELDPPRVTSNEVAFEITGSDLYAYVIAAPINHSAALAVVNLSNLGAPSMKATAAFLAQALGRARAQLDD